MFGVYPHVWGEELLRWHKFFEYSLHSSNNVLASPCRIWGLGKGRPVCQFRHFHEQGGPAEFLWRSAGIPKWFKYADRAQLGSCLRIVNLRPRFWCASISSAISLTTVENPNYPALAPEFLPANPISRGENIRRTSLFSRNLVPWNGRRNNPRNMSFNNARCCGARSTQSSSTVRTAL